LRHQDKDYLTDQGETGKTKMMWTKSPSHLLLPDLPCRRTLRFALLPACAALLLGCAAAPPPATPHDPFEAQNRDIHALNKGFDRNVLRPVASGVGDVVPDPLEIALSNAADNIEAPGEAMNYLLQARPGKAVESSLRFVINSTVGLLGTWDVAAEMGIQRDSTGFGETMYVWGLPEGAYAELPLLGPTTDRDTVGFLIGGTIDPLNLVLTPGQSLAVLGLQAASIAVDRHRYSETFDSVLYDSADSYAQTRLLYLQNRRFELGQTTGDDAFLDPYEDPYAE
jgi:phospholipid-binding lipoprotein MlaA